MFGDLVSSMTGWVKTVVDKIFVRFRPKFRKEV